MFRQATLLLLAALASTSCHASMIVSESRNRLPMSLSTVISDLEAEGMEELSTACLITSRSVTIAQKQAVLDTMLGKDEHLSANSKAVATVKGLALAQPSVLEEVVQCTVACQGLVIYVPSVSDLARGEGLMDHLAPAMERLSQWQASPQGLASSGKACLVVVCDPQVGTKSTQTQLEAAAKPILETNGKRQLEDVFGSVLYLTADQVEGSVLDHRQRPDQTVSPEEAMARVANVVAEDGFLFAPLTNAMSSSSRKIDSQPLELAAARKLEPAKRQAQTNALQVVAEATAQNTQLVAEFGSLCDAALKAAQESLASSSNKVLLQSTAVGKELAANLKAELASEWMDAFEAQLKLLEESCFATMKQSMSKLRLGPTLAHDMQVIAKDTAVAYGKQSKKLIPNSLPGVWKTRASDANASFAKRLQDFCKDRLQAAEASGQFKPVPRKGVTIGMHWLLPKPFGNDYRQEPWMVHAADNLVYVPRRDTKVTEVPEEAVKTGDWRDQVVPSPAGRDMLFMQ